jgi:hypothetical protein
MTRLTTVEAEKRDFILKELYDYDLSNKSFYPYTDFFSDIKQDSKFSIKDEEIEFLIDKIFEDEFIDFDEKMESLNLDGFVGGLLYRTGICIKQEGKYMVEDGGYASTLEQKKLQTEVARNTVNDRDFDKEVKIAQKTYFTLSTAKLIFGLILFILTYLLILFL